MGTIVVSGLVIAMGVVALGVGIASAISSLRAAHRVHHRTAGRATAMLEGWDAWFLQGFSTMTMGIRGLYAILLWLGWTLVGVTLIGLGIRLFDRF